MKILIQAIGSNVTTAQRQALSRLLEKLSTYSKQIISINAVIKRDSNDKAKGLHGELYLSRQGENLFAKGKAGNLYKAVAVATEGLRKQLRKAKTKGLNRRMK